MRRDEDAFLRGEDVSGLGGHKMTPCNDQAFYEYTLHEGIITEQPPYSVMSRPFIRKLFCNNCGASTDHGIQENEATCSACGAKMQVKASPVEHREDIKSYRVGDSVRAKPGTKLHRYLSEFFGDGNLDLKVQESFTHDGSIGHDYLVAPVAMMRKTWVQNQLLPVRHNEIFMENSLRPTGYITSLDRVRLDRYFRFRDTPNGLSNDKYRVTRKLPDSVEVEGQQMGETGVISLGGAKQYNVEILEERGSVQEKQSKYVEPILVEKSWADKMKELL